jgi:maltose phosphorylase
MRAKNGLSFRPVIPSQWQAYAFKIQYQGRTVSVKVTQNGATFSLLAGEPLDIVVDGRPVRLDMS